MGHRTDSPLAALLAAFDMPAEPQPPTPIEKLLAAGIREIVLRVEPPRLNEPLPLNRVLPPLEWLTSDQRELFEERAAIYEYDAGLTHQEAEQEAIAELIICTCNF